MTGGLAIVRPEQHWQVDLLEGEEGTAWLRINPPSMGGLLTLDALRRIGDTVVEAEARIEDPDRPLRALIIACEASHPDLSGYDAEELRDLSEEELVAWSHEGQGLLRRIEDLSIPTVAALHGKWTGAGGELAIACAYRVAASSPGVCLGFPQALNGVVPAWGGSVRLPKLIGLEAAVDLVLTGRSVPAEEALKLQLIDRIVSSSSFVSRVERYALRRVEYGKPRSRRRTPLRRRFIQETTAGRKLVAARVERRLADQSEVGPSVRMSVDLMLQSAVLAPERAYARESGVFGTVILDSSTRARLHAQHCINTARRDSLVPGPEIEAAGVVGAGQTGSDFAHLLLTAGTPVKLKGHSRESVREGVARAGERMVWEKEQGRVSERLAARRAARLEGVTGFGGFGTLDLVIVVDDDHPPSAPADLAEVEAHIRADCILATHDWGDLPGVRSASLRVPERVIGIAPAFPVDRFPLFEIIPGAATTPETISITRRLARRLSLTPIVVSGDSSTPGTRLLGVFLTESARLLAEGATVGQVDSAMEDFGFSVGPFHRVDALGGRRTMAMLRKLLSTEGERMRTTPLFERIADAGDTFYRYRDGVRAGPNNSLPAGLSPGGSGVTGLIRRRILLMLINEAARIVSSGGVRTPGDVEVAAIYGVGFPSHKGGPLYFAEEAGLASIVEELEAAERRYGTRFAPSPMLRDLVSAGSRIFEGPTQAMSGQSGQNVLR